MTIQELLVQRDIKEILHFTTNRGITGMLATGFLKSRNLLPNEARLEFVYQYNCPDRSRDQKWWDYINFSITSVNRHLFGISYGNWHAAEDGWWCILSFTPEICTHDGVYFTTTNNMYSGVKRRQSYQGLAAMFASKIERWTNNIIERPLTLPNNQPTL